MAKVAKLVCISLMTRVIVDEDETDIGILNAARPHFIDRVNNELSENLESIEDDEEMPFDSTFDLVCLNCGEVTMSPYAITYEDALGKHCTCPNCAASFDIE